LFVGLLSRVDGEGFVAIDVLGITGQIILGTGYVGKPSRETATLARNAEDGIQKLKSRFTIF